MEVKDFSQEQHLENEVVLVFLVLFLCFEKRKKKKLFPREIGLAEWGVVYVSQPGLYTN